MGELIASLYPNTAKSHCHAISRPNYLLSYLGGERHKTLLSSSPRLTPSPATLSSSRAGNVSFLALCWMEVGGTAGFHGKRRSQRVYAAAFSASNRAASEPPTTVQPQLLNSRLENLCFPAAVCCVCSLRSVQRNLRLQPAGPEELTPEPGHGLLSWRQVSLIINGPVLCWALGALDPSA